MNVGKIQRVLLFIPYDRKLEFQSHLQKFSPWNLGVPYPPVTGFSIPQKFFSQRNGHFLPICESFLLQKFPTIWLLYSASSDCNIDHLQINNKLFEATFSILNDLMTAGLHITVIQKQEQISDKSHVISDIYYIEKLEMGVATGG